MREGGGRLWGRLACYGLRPSRFPGWESLGGAVPENSWDWLGWGAPWPSRLLPFCLCLCLLFTFQAPHLCTSWLVTLLLKVFTLLASTARHPSLSGSLPSQGSSALPLFPPLPPTLGRWWMSDLILQASLASQQHGGWPHSSSPLWQCISAHTYATF